MATGAPHAGDTGVMVSGGVPHVNERIAREILAGDL